MKIVDHKLNEGQLDDLRKKIGIEEKINLGNNGILNNKELRFKNEPVRHKLLDLIGDLALIGAPIKAQILAARPGHKANVEFAKQVRKLYQQKKIVKKFQFVKKEGVVLDSNAIERILPHRYPFLLVDKVIDLEVDKRVVGIKSVTFNEPFFPGHFPGNPVFPGVLQMEALAQTGGILALSNVDDPQNWDTYFLKMDNVKFKNKVVPGDTLILKMELLSPIRRGIVHMQGTAYVGKKIVSEGELVAQIIKRR